MILKTNYYKHNIMKRITTLLSFLSNSLLLSLVILIFLFQAIRKIEEVE